MEDASMTSGNVTEVESDEPSEAASVKSVDDRLIDELVGRAQAKGLHLTGEDGLLQQGTKRLLESALEGGSLIIWASTSMIPPGRTTATHATAPVPGPC
ncbi:hypothetical protein ACFRH6_33470 [Streptomyces sp. NPDC056749]|uniref:hypothetical protein n=1 Tax=Streptomyces sp. NPDC056749 TaxID=3345936 RepID=UPI0036781C13